MSDFQSAPQNREAGAWLRSARGGRSQAQFAAELTEALGINLEANTLGSYEIARRTVPAPVMLAAARITGIPLPTQEVDQALAAQLKDLLREVRKQAQRQAKFDAELRRLREAKGLESGPPARRTLIAAPQTQR